MASVGNRRTNFCTDACATVYPRYRVRNSNSTLGRVFRETNFNNYFGCGPHLTAAGPGRVVVDTLSRYEAFLGQLIKIDGLDILPAREVFSRGRQAGKTVCTIRHDVDGDVVTAVELARMERALGLRSTFNILHTAPYYGRFGEKPSLLDRRPWRKLEPLRRLVLGRQRQREIVFHRHHVMLDVYRHIQDLGHEIAFHTDGYHIYQAQGFDGAAAVRDEINWLRRNGIDIAGTAPHNSCEAYGSANSGIFVGRAPRHDVPVGPRSFVHDGRSYPLQVLDEIACGLHYEIDDLYQVEPTDYLSPIGHGDWWINRVYPRHIETPFEEMSRRFPSVRHHHVCQERLLDYLASPERATTIMLSVHPEHFGLRARPLEGPLGCVRFGSEHPLSAAYAVDNSSSDLSSYDPGPSDVREGWCDGRLEFQSVVTRNGAGLHDVPLETLDHVDVKIVLIGGGRFGTETIAPGARIGGRIQRKLSFGAGRTFGVVTFAHHNTTLPASLDLASCHVDLDQVNIVLVGIDLTIVDAPSGAWLESDSENLVVALQPIMVRLADLRCRVVLMIERTGAATPAEAAQCAAHAAMRLCARYSVDVIEPYSTFAAYRGSATTHWRSSREWSILGHDTAADCFYEWFSMSSL